MAYTVSFGVMTKRENSTKQGYTEALSASCLLKENTNILNPTFTIQAQIVGDTLLPCNYMYVASFGRYYWITDIEFYHGVWYVSGETDVLATFKTDIGNTTAYVLRSSELHDPYIPDTYVPIENNPTVVHDTATIGFDTTGTIVLTVCGSDGQNSSECFYALSPSSWSELYSIFFTSNFWNDYKTFFLNIFQDVYNSLFDPSEYVTGAKWIPVSYTDIEVVETPVLLGVTNTGLSGKIISPSTPLMTGSKVFVPPDHPQRATTGFHWLNGNITSKRSLFLPGVGTIPIDSDPLIINPSVILNWGIDCTGVIYYKIITGGRFMNLSGDLSCPVGFSDTRNNPTAAVGSLVQMMTSAQAGNGVGFMAGIQSGIESAFPNVTVISTGGSRMTAGLSTQIDFSSMFYHIPVQATYDTIGKPFCHVTLLSSGGYILCDRSVSVQCTGATRSEIERINSYLSGGFYYE